MNFRLLRVVASLPITSVAPARTRRDERCDERDRLQHHNAAADAGSPIGGPASWGGREPVPCLD